MDVGMDRQTEKIPKLKTVTGDMGSHICDLENGTHLCHLETSLIEKVAFRLLLATDAGARRS